jgi:hypothetical protein
MIRAFDGRGDFFEPLLQALDCLHFDHSAHLRDIKPRPRLSVIPILSRWR